MVKSADVATDVLVRLQAEGNNRNKTKGEPFPALVDTGREVAAVLTLRSDIFVTFQEGREGCEDGQLVSE